MAERIGVMTPSQVEEALRAQKAGEKKTLGEIAVRAVDRFLAP